MKGLLIKDFRLMAGQKRFFGATVVFMVLFVFSGMAEMTIGYLTFIGALFALGTISYDEFDNGNAFLFSLPFDRKEYLLEKYLFGLLTGVAGSLLANLAVLASSLVGGAEYHLGEMLLTSLACLAVASLAIAFILPMQIKYGAEKGRYFAMGLYGILFLLIFLAVKSSQGSPESLEAAEAWFTSLDPIPVAIAAVLIYMTVMSVSYLVGMKILEKKQF